ncbi:SIMPL domain-containing protein [Brevundimonas lutea]|uniref:SIMPL domain-containing protein n=1 Tax=Brevundimonas lutea TaxID=2293980 RepID=UPI000F0204D2|nr:SIMPL domain-containing protein [Brevundimonas lutea]
MPRIRLAGPLAASAAALALVAGAAPALAQSQPAAPAQQVQIMAQYPALNLAAHGEVKIAPDKADINFGVVTEAPTAAEAMAQNAERMTRVMRALTGAGIAERDIQTSGLNLQAQYDYVQDQPPRLRGYQATNRVTVLVRDVEAVGTTADAVVAAGVNQIDGITFGLIDPTEAENQARQLAVRALQNKAEVYAQATGLRLAGLRSLTEAGGYQPQPPMPMYRMALQSSADAASTPVSSGELSVRIDITGVYDLAR